MSLYHILNNRGVLGALITEFMFVVRQLAIYFLVQRVARKFNSSLLSKVSDGNPVKRM